MEYVGMDVSKREIVTYDSSLTPVHHSINNTSTSIQKFLQSHYPDPSVVLFGCESTGDYHLVLCSVCINLGFSIKLLNPILTKKVIRTTIRNKKTDLSDAEIIAKLIQDNHGVMVTKEYLIREKRTALRVENRLTQMTAILKRLQISLQQKAVVMNVQRPLCVVQESITFLENQKKTFLSDILDVSQDRQEILLDSIPGCGQKLSAIISAEAGDISRFPSSDQFKAFVGIDPKVTQSGESLHTGHITKRGNPMLRYALFLVANSARRYDPQLKAFYEKKRSEGKSHRHAVCTVIRKLCERIYAIVSKNELYDPNHQFIPHKK